MRLALVFFPPSFLQVVKRGRFHRNGWLHTGKLDDTDQPDKFGYFCSSSLVRGMEHVGQYPSNSTRHIQYPGVCGWCHLPVLSTPSLHRTRNWSWLYSASARSAEPGRILPLPPQLIEGPRRACLSPSLNSEQKRDEWISTFVPNKHKNSNKIKISYHRSKLFASFF